jgi:hypothetical protein
MHPNLEKGLSNINMDSCKATKPNGFMKNQLEDGIMKFKLNNCSLLLKTM